MSTRVGTSSGHVRMERLLNEVTDGLLELETCSGHVCIGMLLNEMTDCQLKVGHAKTVYVWRGFSMR